MIPEDSEGQDRKIMNEDPTPKESHVDVFFCLLFLRASDGGSRHGSLARSLVAAEFEAQPALQPRSWEDFIQSDA